MANVPETWGTYEEAISHFKAHNNNGIRTIGFEVDKSPFIGIDIDHCRCPETGEIEAWAQGVISALDSYTEVSPSGTGIRMFVTTDEQFPLVNRKKGSLGKSKEGAIEIANAGKYFSVTGKHLEATPDWICNRPKELREIFDLYFPEKTPENISVVKTITTLEDNEILQKAGNAKNGEAFKKLHAGDRSDYPSQSEADMALCCMLAFWCGNNPEQIDRIFRTSGLMRPKWEREDYRTQTIQRAIEKTNEVYRGPSINASPLHEKSVLTFPDIMTGVAGEYADLYSTYLEAPKHFFYISFLACLGFAGCTYPADPFPPCHGRNLLPKSVRLRGGLKGTLQIRWHIWFQPFFDWRDRYRHRVARCSLGSFEHGFVDPEPVAPHSIWLERGSKGEVVDGSLNHGLASRWKPRTRLLRHPENSPCSDCEQLGLKADCRHVSLLPAYRLTIRI